MHNINELQVLTALSSPSSDELNCVKLATFAGLYAKVVKVGSNFMELLESDEKKPHTVAISVESLKSLIDYYYDSEKILYSISKQIRYLYVFGFQYDNISLSILRLLLDDNDSSFLKKCGSTDEYCQISNDFKNVTKELSGIKLKTVNTETDIVFNLDESFNNNIDPYIEIKGRPYFFSKTHGNCRIFFHGTNKLLDIDKPALSDFNIVEVFPQFIPTLMFLRYAFGDFCWHNNRQYANLIIDDPYLKKKYGFVDYEKLVGNMDSNNYTTTIAFIPWNYKRTEKNTAELFINRKDRLSLCVHGCDHTGGEFGETDAEKLDSIVNKATRKMELHKESTNVHYNKIMVFPQGRFSSAAMRSLDNGNYIAAINTIPFPTDLSENRLRIADILDVCITKYSEMPLFLRNYPSEDIDIFLIYAFLNKPLFIVEHHNFFKNGFSEINEFIQKINTIPGNTIWTDPGKIVHGSYVQKFIDETTIHCRIFCNYATVYNDTASKLKYVIRREGIFTPVKAVFVDGRLHKYTIEDNILTINLQLAAESLIKVKIVTHSNKNVTYPSDRLLNRLKVFIRRYLSDFRDNYLSKNEHISLLTKKIKNKLIK